ncbi:hypothetical protein PU912_09010 [Acinetobacter baumannii]|uniref:hypothetical protein n=1 Tax=Acinetobacter baumannii TaxID=470 RepID=UPI00234112B1|nr:hypothetical protein [Acinetobacter baumannii]MDC5529330.1 hypothetical protein [Acinetobacter baumannii]MDD7975770.1 hypothetical protein [Acinetobacter baumannii]MDO8918085.1 hypothetical protein [Acinetobacter baumannii]
MLFKLHPDTPKFQVFVLLNQELIYFLNKSIKQQRFGRRLFSYTDVGTACWDNYKIPSGKSDLTRDKFKKLFENLKNETEDTREQLHRLVLDNQDLSSFFLTPNPALLDFLLPNTFEAFKVLAAHLYGATKDLQPIINAAGGVNIHEHFEAFRVETLNGNICKACGMRELAPFRANIGVENQWRADYDHQLCKSKYPLFAVHPDNLIPLCDVCNQDAKKAKNLFATEDISLRYSFYPFSEEANSYISLTIENLRDPSPIVKIRWNTREGRLVNKLDTWDDVYEIKNRAEGHFTNIEQIIENEIDPTEFEYFQQQVQRRTRSISGRTLKSKPWAYWYHKFFCELDSIHEDDKVAFWERSRFVHNNAKEAVDYILKI